MKTNTEPLRAKRFRLSNGFLVVTSVGMALNLGFLGLAELFVADPLKRAILALGILPFLGHLYLTAKTVRVRLLEPLNGLQEAMLAAEHGDFDHTLPKQDSVEFSELEESFDRMRVSLKTQHRQLASALNESESNRLSAALAEEKRFEFLHHMTHELRTPLNGIIGMAELTMMNDLSEEDYQSLCVIRDCGESLLVVVNGILNYERQGAGKVQLAPVLLSQLIDLEISMHLPMARSKGLRVDVNRPEEVVFTDAEKLALILRNLLSNAIKFTLTGGVTVDCTLVEDLLTISVTDTGVGIRNEELREVMKPFRSGTRNLGTTAGLGLSMCERIVTQLRGEIRIKSEVGVGTEVILTIPVQLPE